jgi:hypothetical protein
MSLRHLLVASTLALLLLADARAGATTIDPLSFDELLFGADFVGVVECQTAGEIVATYRVVDSWKGPPVGAVLNLRIAPNAWGPQIPSVLVGEQALVAAFKSSPTRRVSTTDAPPVPLWSRALPVDVETPLFQGFEPLPVNGQAELLGSHEKSVPAVLNKARAWLARVPAEQEARILAELARRQLDHLDELEANAPRPPALAALLDKLDRAREPRGSIQALLAYGKATKGAAWPVATVLGRAGPATLSTLRALPETREDQLLTEAVHTLEARLEHRDVREADRAPRPSAARLSTLHQALLGGPERAEAVRVLAPLDCGAVVTALATFKADPAAPTAGYLLGALVGHGCGQERAKNLAALADGAIDGWLRTSAAIALASDDAAPGAERLKRLAAGKGGPALMASLALARRGDTMGMPALLTSFAEKLDPRGDGPLIAQLQTRTLVLLSNSAARAHVAAPPIEPLRGRDSTSVNPPSLSAWWQSTGSKIPLADPWLPALDALHVD